jgi:translation initiation factor 2 alpha subunit (eIF-2alpha)
MDNETIKKLAIENGILAAKPLPGEVGSEIYARLQKRIEQFTAAAISEATKQLEERYKVQYQATSNLIRDNEKLEEQLAATEHCLEKMREAIDQADIRSGMLKIREALQIQPTQGVKA